ncbi:MFS transporter [Streptomyces diastatochromogenes]|nr:MFS transporter [Streptomyces diastatochromogenes]
MTAPRRRGRDRAVHACFSVREAPGITVTVSHPGTGLVTTARHTAQRASPRRAAATSAAASNCARPGRPPRPPPGPATPARAGGARAPGRRPRRGPGRRRHPPGRRRRHPGPRPPAPLTTPHRPRPPTTTESRPHGNDPATGAPAGERPAVDWRRVSSLVIGQAAVQAGSFALLIAMSWTAVQLGGREAVTYVTLSATLPRALLLLFGGALADVLGPRAVLLRATTVRVLVLAAGIAVTATTETLWPLIAVALVDGVLLGLTGPASGVLLPRLAPQDQLGRANSLFSMVLRLAPIAGSPLGAWLVVVGGLPVAMTAAAAGCVVWLVCTVHVTHGMTRPERAPQGPSLLRRSGDGFRLLAAHPRLRWMFVACFCMDLAFLWPAEVALPCGPPTRAGASAPSPRSCPSSAPERWRPPPWARRSPTASRRTRSSW